jgi:hypothetical protein
MLGLFGRLVDLIIVIIKALYMLKCIRLPHLVHFQIHLFDISFHYCTIDLPSRAHRPAVSLEEADMLSMSDVLTISITENLLDFHTLLPLDSRDLSSGIVYQSSTNLFRGTLPHLAVRSRGRSSLDCHEPYDFLLGKVTFNINDTDREQASLAHKSLVSPRVNVESAVRVRGVKQPKVTVPNGIIGGHETGM